MTNTADTPLLDQAADAAVTSGKKSCAEESIESMPASPSTAIASSASKLVLERLKIRRQFLAVAGTGRKWVTKNFIIQVKSPKTPPKTPQMSELAEQERSLEDMKSDERVKSARVGFTVTKKVGNAVVRNRVRRRLREMVRIYMPEQAQAGWDYVFIGRLAALDADFTTLQKDLKWALKKLHSGADLHAGKGGERSHQGKVPLNNKSHQATVKKQGKRKKSEKASPNKASQEQT